MELYLSAGVLTEYTLSERYVMFCKLCPNFTHHILRSMYWITLVSMGGKRDQWRGGGQENFGKCKIEKIIKFFYPVYAELVYVMFCNLHLYEV